MRETQQGRRRHKLLTAEIRAALPPLRSQDGKGEEALVPLKMFCPYSQHTMFIIEASVVVELPNGDLQDLPLSAPIPEGARVEDIRMFGLVHGDFVELGDVSFTEIEAATVKLFGHSIPAIERDCHWHPKTVGECRALIEKLYA